MKVGFIGLGNMGAPMADNLVKVGHEVVAFDISEVRIEGAVRAEDAAAVASGADAIITMLPNGTILNSIYSEVVPHCPEGCLLIDCSTVDVDSALQAHRRAAAANLLSLDAPVSGGVGGAEAGTLTFMVGGSADALELGSPLLQAMGQKTVHCGDAGAGQVAKICNNMLLGITMAGVCEIFNLGDKLGLSRQKLFDVVSTSSGACWSMNTYCPAPGVGPSSPADKGYAPGFAASLMLKDLNLSQQAAAGVQAATPLGALACSLYSEFAEAGGADRDFSAMLLHLGEKQLEAHS
ncbi:3-hydroxyisobutyrate dehydrogenase [Roseibium sp.]|uniref:3-hydroxyisobutyrate dehydrogenase n=1 Tax=Roseibium sp. TaxID=1936156 RepID=UPI003517EDE7